MSLLMYLLVIALVCLTIIMGLKYKILRFLIMLPLALLVAQAAAYLIFGD